MTTESRVYTHPEIIRVIGGITLCILLSALDQTIVAPAIPAMTADLQGFGDFAWIVSAYLLTSTAATPIIGKLSDIHGRRTLTLASIVLFTAASLLCAMSQTLAQLVAFRALQGIGGAGLIGMAHAAIADVVSPRERGRYQVYMSGMWGIASIGGPVAGGLLTDHLSWRSIFWINLPLAAVAYRLSSRALLLLPRHGGSGARIDVPGAGLLTVAVVCCLMLIGQLNGHGGRDPALLAALALVFGASLALLIWQEHRAADPVLPPRLFGNAVVVRGLILSFTNALIAFATTLLVPLHVQLAQGISAGGSGLVLTPYLLTFVALSFSGGRLSRRLGRTRAIMSAAFACCTAGLLLLATVTADTSPALTILYSLLIGAGIGLVQPNITVTIQNACERRDVGVATGAMLLSRSIGGSFGAALAGALVAQGMAGGAAALDTGFRIAFLACAVVAAISLGVTLTTRDLALRST